MRVDAFWKTSATIRSRSASDERGAAFSSAARVQQRPQLVGGQLGAGEEVARQGAGGYVAMLVLSWNLFHGRSVPDAPRSLLADFAEQLAAWEWDVALLQEVPPWWPAVLGRACRASARTALTSRNWLLPVSRRAAERRPDVIKSWGGGANAILGARRGRCSSIACARCAPGPSGAWCTACAWSAAGGSATCTPSRTPRPARSADVARAADTAIAWSAGAPGRPGRRPQHARSGGGGLRSRRRPQRRPRPRATAARRGPGAYAGARPALGPRAGAG